MRRALCLAVLLALSGCGLPPVVAASLIGAGLGAWGATANLDVKLIDLYLATHDLQSAPKLAVEKTQ